MVSKSVQAVQAALMEKGLAVKVVEFPATTRTAQEAAQAIGCRVAQIAKSLIFRTQQTHRAILVLASGVNRVNEKVIAQQVGEEIVKADADFTREVTGYAIGGIPPLGHQKNIETYIDEDLLKHKEVWAAAGTPHSVFAIEAALLEKLTGGRVISIK